MEDSRVDGWQRLLPVLLLLLIVTTVATALAGGVLMVRLVQRSARLPSQNVAVAPPPPVTSRRLTLLGGDPSTLDPARSNDTTSARYVTELFNGLVTLNPQLEVTPDLAQEWSVDESGTRYRFLLHEGLTFADGRPLTTEDVRYSLERACDPATGSPGAATYLGDLVGCVERLQGQADHVRGIEVRSPREIVLQIDAPKVYFLAKLTYPTGFVVDRTVVERHGRGWAEVEPNGAGPFRLADYDPGSRLVLAPNPLYHGSPAPEVEQVTFRLGPADPMTLYETGEVDAITVGPADIDRVLDPVSPFNSQLQAATPLQITYLAFNVRRPPFDDPLVRRALSLAVDRVRLVEVLDRGTAIPAAGILPPGLPGYNPDLEPIPFDPAAARAALAASRYGDAGALPPLTLHVSGESGSPGSDIEAIVEMWEQHLGIEVAVEMTAWETFLMDISDPENPYDMFTLAWVADYADPENFLDLLFHCRSGENRSGYCNPEVDRWLERARVEPVPEARLALYRQAEAQIVRDAAWLPLSHPRSFRLIRPGISHFPPLTAVAPVLQHVRFDP